MVEITEADLFDVLNLPVDEYGDEEVPVFKKTRLGNGGDGGSTGSFVSRQDHGDTHSNLESMSAAVFPQTIRTGVGEKHSESAPSQNSVLSSPKLSVDSSSCLFPSSQSVNVASDSPVAPISVPGRPKPMGRSFDWQITILTPQTFKKFVEIIYRVLSQCPFQLIKTKQFTGVRVDQMDSSMVCMIKASFECEISAHIDLSNESFSVNTDTFSTLLKDVQAGHILTLTRYTESGDLTLNSYSRENESNRSMCTLPILDEESGANQLRMQDITYQYMVEMDLPKLKNYCKMAQEINSSHMQFGIDEPVGRVPNIRSVSVGEDNESSVMTPLSCTPFHVGRCGEEKASSLQSPTQIPRIAPPTPPSDPLPMQNLFFTIGGYSDVATFKKVHQSIIHSEKGGAHVQFYIKSTSGSSEVEDGGQFSDGSDREVMLENKYDEIFSTSYLNVVLKSMDRQTVQLYMSKGLPLVIRYNLGNDQSHIHIILAPRIQEDS
jgi:hypothetical protein